MAEAWKILGQVAPSAATDTTLYTCPASTQVISRLFVSNRGSTDAMVRIAVRPNGAALANQHYLVYDYTIGARDTLDVPGIAFDANDVVTVRASTADCSFTLSGVELT